MRRFLSNYFDLLLTTQNEETNRQTVETEGRASLLCFTNLIFSVYYSSRPIVAAHDAHVTVRPGQLERVGDLVHIGVEERERAVEPASLCVVVVSKHQSITGTQLPPTFAVVPQPRQALVLVLADDVAEVLPVAEFRHVTYVHVLVGTHRLDVRVTYLSV